MNDYYNSSFLSRWLGTAVCTIVLILLGCGISNASAGQQVDKVNLDVHNTEVKEVLKKIKAQTAFDFVYNAREINDEARISVKVQDADIHTALKACLDHLNVDYVIQDKIIVLQQKKEVPQEQSEVLVLKGKVSDADGRPLTGVSVLLKGTAIGVATDADGRFTLRLPAGNGLPELLFSFIGMQPESYQVKDPLQEIRITLRESSETLNEVIVTGMETVKKEHMTGSAVVITSKDLQMQGITSIDRILEGRIAGLNSTTLSGAPGTRSKITIRGENNLSGNTEPLWIVDGLPLMSGVPQDNSGDYAGTIMQDGVGNIMPEDIESISILKDASAAAIYGARAANGVIVITTKKGFRSKTQVNYSGTYECGIAPRNRLDFMNAAEKLQYERSIINNFGLDYAKLTGRGGYMYKRSVDGYLSPLEYQTELQRLSRVNTDWFDVLFRTAQSHSHNISLRGGTEELTYYTSLNYQEKNGILISNRYQNAGLLVKLDWRPLDNLIVALNVSANSRKNRDNASVINPFTYAMFANPYERPYDDEGNYAADLSYLSNNYTSERASGYKYDHFNILREMRDTRKKQDGLDAELTFDIRYEVIPGLSLESIVRKGVSYNTDTREVDAGTYTSWKNEIFGKEAYSGYKIMPEGYDNGELSENSGKNYNWSIRNQIDYSFTVKKDHLFSILLANEVMSKKFTNFGYTSPIYYSDYRITGVPTFNKDVLYEDLQNAVGGMFNTSDGQDRSVSFLGSLRYGYKDRYVLNFNYRADGADVIGNTNRFTPLWSVGVRYNLHNEKFFKNPVVSELALRGSYGYTGNIDRTAYPFSTISFGSDMYNGYRYATNFTYPNPTVGWEKKKDRNIGLDMSLFDNRINFTFDYYSNRTEDVLEDLEVPNSTGRTSVKANGGIVENSGVEVYLNIRWVKQGDFTFSTAFNMSRNKNIIKKSHYDYNSYQEMLEENSGAFQGGVVNIIGKETGSIYGWKYAGVNPETGNPRYYLTEAGKRAYSVVLDGWGTHNEMYQKEYDVLIKSKNEIPEYVDYNRGTGVDLPYMRSSLQYLGRSNPKYVGGFSTTMRYKGLEFVTSWTFKVGHLIPNFNDYQNAPKNGAGVGADLNVSATNREKKYLYYWQFPGDVTDVPRFTTSNWDYWASSCISNNYSKGNYLRLTNLSLSYRFPSKIVNKMRMNTLLLGFNARNLLTFTKYRGLDVGTGSAFSYPVAREFNFKLTVGF